MKTIDVNLPGLSYVWGKGENVIEVKTLSMIKNVK
jgi:hypothetical protein